jgi:3-oxoadipate enol-lactonase
MFPGLRARRFAPGAPAAGILGISADVIAEVNGARLWYEVGGDGPAVALLHSTVCDSRMWDAEFAALSGRYRALRFDLRGYGRSELPPGPFSFVDDLHSLLDLAGMEKAALVGLSGGSALALDFVLAHPDRVSRVVLAAPAVGGRTWSDDVQRFWAEEERLLDAGDVDAAVELNLRLWVDGPRRGPDAVDPAVRAKVGEMQRRAFDLDIAAYSREPQPGPHQGIEPPAIERLEDVAVPTLVVVGAADFPDVLDGAQALAERIPGARKVVLPDTAHMVNLERPEEFQALVADFLAGLPG